MSRPFCCPQNFTCLNKQSNAKAQDCRIQPGEPWSQTKPKGLQNPAGRAMVADKTQSTGLQNPAGRATVADKTQRLKSDPLRNTDGKL